MLGPLSKVNTINTYDALAEIPVVGTVSSTVRFAHNILAIAMNALKCISSAKRPQALANMKIQLIELRMSLVEFIPLYGNFYAVKMNKASNSLSDSYYSEELKSVKSFLAKRIINQRQKFFAKLNQMNEKELGVIREELNSTTHKSLFRDKSTAWQREVSLVINRRLTLLETRSENIANVKELSKEELKKKNNIS